MKPFKQPQPLIPLAAQWRSGRESPETDLEVVGWWFDLLSGTRLSLVRYINGAWKGPSGVIPAPTLWTPQPSRAIAEAKPSKPIVIIESPYAGDVERNLDYLDRCLYDSLRRGEAPYASHGLYPRRKALDDTIPEERELGMEAGHAFLRVADLVAVYTDLGVSPGMERGIQRAEEAGVRTERRGGVG